MPSPTPTCSPTEAIRPSRNRRMGVLLVATAALCTTFSACRGGPCSTCNQGYPYSYGYQQPYANPGQYPAAVPQQAVPGAAQPGGFYSPGTVPVAPMQAQPGY